MDSNTYTAASIGPIVSTLDAARKTRELWGASYLFSYIMRETVKKLRNGHTVLLPYYDLDEEWMNEDGAGVFPDKIIVEGDIKIKEEYTTVIKETSQKMASWLTHAAKTKLDARQMEKYLLQFFRFVEVTFPCASNENIVDKATTLIDARELQSVIIPYDPYVDKENPLFYFLYHVNGSFLFRDGFNRTRKRFPSLIEIAASELKQRCKDKFEEIENRIENEQERFDSLSEEKSQKKQDEYTEELFTEKYGVQFTQVHKYVAIVQADGDGIGKLINKVGTKPRGIEQLSKRLIKFSHDALNVSIQYGASPIYMGADDLFFFAPLIWEKDGKKTELFDLIEALDETFQDVVVSHARDNMDIPVHELPSLSFGVSFSYYKFPLYEARRNASNALFYEIKKSDQRNAVNIKFRKHSGQMISISIPKRDENLWKKTIAFINHNLDADNDFLNSFTHKLRLQDAVIFNEKVVTEKSKLEWFFKNNYNEVYVQFEKFFDSLRDFIVAIHSSKEVTEKQQYLYSILRYIHFIRS